MSEPPLGSLPFSQVLWECRLVNPYTHQATWGRTDLDSPEANILPMFCDALQSIHSQFQVHSKPNIHQQTAQNSWRSSVRAKDTLQCLGIYSRYIVLSFVRIIPHEYVIYLTISPKLLDLYFSLPSNLQVVPFATLGSFVFIVMSYITYTYDFTYVCKI